MINLPRESSVTGTINSDRVDSPRLTSNNPVRNGKAVDGAAEDTFQEEESMKGSSFTGTCKDIPHAYIIVSEGSDTT